MRVCVKTPANVSHIAIAPEALRTRLAQEIDGSRAKVKVEAVEIPSGDPSDEIARAQEQRCRLIVSTRIEQTFGYSYQNQDPATRQPPMTRGETLATRRASLNYSIRRVDGKGHVEESAIPLRAGGADAEAAADAVRDLAPHVVHAAVKSKP